MPRHSTDRPWMIRYLEQRAMTHRLAILALLWLVSGLASAAGAEDASQEGKQVYVQQCASCHGRQGEGVAEKYEEPLHGDRSLDELTRIIEETMPEEDPKQCVGQAARAVAEYIHGTFYTAEARARNKPPRVELARLTVPQYRQAVADLLATFLGQAQADDRRGLAGEYYDARNFRREKRVSEQVDPQVEFSFGVESPLPEKIGKEEFSIRWQGSLRVEESGEYEFAVHTENGTRLWVNDLQTPLIDAWVASGRDVKQHRAAIFLLAGREYPIRLDFFKFKDPTASIALHWKPPAKAWQPVPQRHLVPRSCPPTLVVSTPFPPDDSSVGYERGTSVSKSWHTATTYAAVEVARKVADHLDALSRSKPGAEDRTERLKEFCRRFAERAFRRPLTEAQAKFFVDSQFATAEEPEEAAKRVVLLVLKSPRFLYLPPGEGSVDDYDVAGRLSFGLWDSLPDQALLDAAARGELKTREQVTRQAQRMLDAPRARAKMRQFFHHWLQFDEADGITKDEELFPGFDEQLVADLRTSLELFLEDVIWDETSDYRQLLLADYAFVNRRLAEFYGLEPPAEDGFQKVSLDPKQRAGVVTHPYLMAAFAYHKSSSPIHRGVFVTRKLLSRSLKPPPMAIEFMDGRFDPHLTMREKVAELTSPMACQTCHRIINPLGFSLENYDAVGRFRTQEGQRQVDAASDYTTSTGQTVRLTGARDLAQLIVSSEPAQEGFVEHLFHHVVKQPVAAYGSDRLSELRRTWDEANLNVRELLVEIAVTGALHGVEPQRE